MRVETADRRGSGLTSMLALVLFVVAVLLVLLDIADGQGLLRDVDDGLREYQIRLYLSGASSWFDLSMPQIRTPDLYVSPWSRLVDLPYVLLYWAYLPLLGETQALSASFSTWPLVMLAIYVMLVAKFVTPVLLQSEWPILRIILISVLMMVLMSVAVLEFVPGRIDHHNVQILCALAMMLGLRSFDRRGGVLIGLASAISVVVGLECLPMIAVAYGGMALAWFVDPERSARVLSWAGGTLAIFSIVLAVAFISPAALSTVACDSFSAPYAYLAVGYGLIAAAVPLWFGRVSLPGRLAAMVLPSLAMLALVIALFPGCLAGPYWMIDDIARRYWLDPIAQEHGLWHQLELGHYAVASSVMLLVIILFAALGAILPQAGRRPGLAVALAVACAVAVLTLAQMRFIRFAAAMIPLFLPYVLLALTDRVQRRRVLQGVYVSFGGFAIFALAFLMVPKVAAAYRVEMSMGNPCDKGDFSVLATLPSGRILAPHGLGVPLLLHGDGRHPVNAVPFHRAAPGMSLGFQAFAGSDAYVRQRIVKGFSYVAVCRLPQILSGSGHGLYETLARGEPWPGLVPVDTGAGNPLQIYRIDQQNLR